MIPFLDMKSVYAELKPELDAAFARVMESGWFVLGKEVEAFEAEYAAFCGTRHCVGLGNGLEALELVLRGWDLGVGDVRGTRRHQTRVRSGGHRARPNPDIPLDRQQARKDDLGPRRRAVHRPRRRA